MNSVKIWPPLPEPDPALKQREPRPLPPSSPPSSAPLPQPEPTALPLPTPPPPTKPSSLLFAFAAEQQTLQAAPPLYEKLSGLKKQPKSTQHVRHQQRPRHPLPAPVRRKSPRAKK